MRLMRSYQLNGVLKIRWRMLKIFGVILSPFKAWCTDSREIHVYNGRLISKISFLWYVKCNAFGTVAIGIMIETEPCYNSAV